MKKLFKRIAVFMALFIGLCSMASCSSDKDFYDEWSDAGATFYDDYKIFKEISVDTAESKIGNVDFVLILASSESSECVNIINLFSEYAKDYDYKGDIYVVDSTEIIKKYSTVKETAEKLKLVYSGGSDIEGCPFVVACYNEKGEVVVDTSSKKLINETYQNETSVDYDALINFIYSGDVKEL